MLGENIKLLRKQRGLTQEELAIRLHVVRQTVSKWEKNLSVPDAGMLQKMADVLDVSVNELLGADIKTEPERNELAEQLARINEQLVIRNRRSRRIWTTIAVVLALIVLTTVITAALGGVAYKNGVTHSVSMSAEDPLYSEQEVNDAFSTVTKYFKKNFKGCNLSSISYDESMTLSEGATWAAKYNSDEAIILLSDFTTGSKVGDGLNPNSTYRGWKWILTRNGNGEWEVSASLNEK